VRYAVSCVIVLCLAVPAVGQRTADSAQKPATGSAGQSDLDQVQQIEAEWLKAERTTDPSALERVLSDDFVNLAPNGLAPGKAQLIKSWQAHAGQPPPYTVDTFDMHIYFLGDAAVAAYSKTYTAKETGSIIREDTTHVFTKESGSWKLRLSRSSFH